MTFTEAIAARTGFGSDDVEAVLSEHGVQPQPMGAAPVSLVVDRVAFSGTKRREGRDDEPFAFDRQLGPGLWVVASEAVNLAGKSTVLLVIRWALTGRSHLTDDVYSWIERVELEGRVGDESFSVRFAKSPEAFQGELLTGGRSTPFEATSFQEVMESFFLDRLRLDATPFWQARPGGGSDEGDRRRFGWTGYFPALHLRADNSTALLGDQVLGGHPGALMQVFLGLPWALTAASARVAAREVQMRRSARVRRSAEDAKARDGQLTKLRSELADAERALAALHATRAPVSPEEADRRLQSYAEALTEQRKAEAAAEAARAALTLVQEDVDEAVKRLNALEQSRVVRPLLGRLAPTMCPRCHVPLGATRVAREQDAHECSVCAEPLLEAVQDEDELAAAQDAVQEAREQHAIAETELAAAQSRRATAASHLEAAAKRIEELETQKPAQAETLELERSVARLQGRLEQSGPQEVDGVGNDDLDIAHSILQAALAEAEARRREAATTLLQELGEEIAELGRAFGIVNLETASPKLNAGLGLRIGGSDSSFSHRTGGERLRLRLATVVALLRVARRLGVGRHPGLLLIDSPAGEEMVEGDVTRILGELRAVCEELPGLELVCATTRVEEVRQAVEDDHIIHGPDYREVW